MYVSSYYNKREKIHPIENIFNNSIQIFVKKYSMGCMYHHIIIKERRYGTNHTTTQKNICYLIC